ncbi:unnamed protein product, partial [Prorocentrum cordatum]
RASPGDPKTVSRVQRDGKQEEEEEEEDEEEDEEGRAGQEAASSSSRPRGEPAERARAGGERHGEREMRKRSAEHATQRAQPSAHRVRALKPLGASSCTFLAAAGAQLPQPQAAVDLVHKKGRRRDSLEFQKVILRPVSVAPRHPTPRLL